MSSSLRLYNTLTRTKEDFSPIDPGNVRMYVCGPTVYDYAHIGNARPVIVFDVLYRLLKHLAKQGVWDGGKGETNVTYARNLTDVDDKINARAARDFPGLALNEAIARVTQATTAQFHADIAALGCLPPDEEPRATDHIAEMQAIIERLIARGVAYVAEEHVLFHVPAVAHLRNAPKYGSLARRPLDEMIAGARVDVAPYKRDPMDFVLWKPSRDGIDPGWLWPQGAPEGITVPGRPGWHIECSAMSMAKLLAPFGGGLACDDPKKNVFDIHGGGIDLVFPHHENEIAQSCCAFGGGEGAPRMANYWMHNGFLQVEGEKMSKSVGNFVTINELLETEVFGGRRWPGEVLRLAMLKTHYRQPIDWTVKALEERWSDLRNWSAHIARLFEQHGVFNYEEGRFTSDPFGGTQPSIAAIDALVDDLNTAELTAHFHELKIDMMTGSLRAAHQLLRDLDFVGVLGPQAAMVFASGINVDIDAAKNWDLLLEALRVAMLNKNVRQEEAIISRLSQGGCAVEKLKNGFWQIRSLESTARSLIEARREARRAKNFAESDRIRDELAAMGIALKDGKDSDGQPTTTWEVKR